MKYFYPLVLVLTGVLLSSPAAKAATVYAKSAATGTGDGSSWANAADLATALLIAQTGDDVWLMEGIHLPTNDVTGTASPADPRTVTFSVKSGVRLYGGFDAASNAATVFTDRNPIVNPTVLEGNIGDPSIDTDNAYHVVTVSALLAATRIEGIIVEDGRADDATDYQGITNGNQSGGGIFLIDTDVNFSIADCILQNNYASAYGGAWYAQNAPSTATNLVFSGNFAQNGGAVLIFDSGTLSFTNSVFNNNNASGGGGGAIYNTNLTTLNLNNITFATNISNIGALAVYNETGCTVNMTNCIVWNTMNPSGNNVMISTQGTTNVTNSLVKGGFPGANNLDTDPQFFDINNPLGLDGVWRTADDGLQINTCSPCFNAGDNVNATATDIIGGSRFYPSPTSLDMGAYELQNIATPVVINIAGTTSFCDMTTLTASGGTDYVWSGGASSLTAINTFDASGTYTVTVTDAATTCSGYKTVAITEESPTVSITTLSSDCTTYNVKAIVGGSGNGASFVWSGGSSMTTAANTFSANGTYEVTVTNAFSCSTTASVIVYFPPVALSRIYVDKDAVGLNTGASWADAFTDLQTALNLGCHTPAYDIWVAEGIYKPTSGTDRTISFNVPNGASLYGGFQGTEVNLVDRPAFSNLGDAGVASVSVLSGAISLSGLNSATILKYTNPTLPTTLDGFVVTASRSDDISITAPGAISIDGGGINVAITNCNFQMNNAGYGGAIYLTNGASPNISTSTFFANYSVFYGGGVYADVNCNPSFYNVLFKDNYGGVGGGAIKTVSNNTIGISNCVFDNNTATDGGAIAVDITSTVAITNSIFDNNYAPNSGNGAIQNDGTVTANNCSFVNNRADVGAAVLSDNATTIVHNSILWGNTVFGAPAPAPVVTADHTIFESLSIPAGTGNKNTNPLFRDIANGKGLDNTWLTADDGLQLTCLSSAIDAADNVTAPAMDILEASVYNTTRDAGAYERTAEACPGGIFITNPICRSILVTNVNGNGYYDFISAGQIIASINPNGQNLGNVNLQISDEGTPITYLGNLFFGRGINLSSTIVPTLNYTLRLYYFDSELTNYNASIAPAPAVTLSDMNIAWASGGSGCSIPSYVGTSVGSVDNSMITNADYGLTNDGFYLQFNLDHFTIFGPTIASGSPLPVTWKYVAAKNSGKTNALITWGTASEVNAKNFEVQRHNAYSNKFEIVATVAALNRTNGADYSFIDRNLPTGLYYYRIKEIDFNGLQDYSATVTVQIGEERAVVVFPNPTRDIVNIVTTNKQQTTVLTDVLGRVLESYNVTPNVLDLSRLVNGVYFLKIGDEVTKLVKEN